MSDADLNEGYGVNRRVILDASEPGPNGEWMPSLDPALVSAVIDDGMREAAGLQSHGGKVLIIDDHAPADARAAYEAYLRSPERTARLNEAYDKAVFDEMVKLTPPKPKPPTKWQKRLIKMRDFFRRHAAEHISAAQHIHQTFLRAKFGFVKPSVADRMQKALWRREESRYPDPVPPGKQHQANARRRRQMGVAE